MNASDVIELLDLLEENGLEIYVDGGWAVDALLGEQTRPHDDLDIAVPHRQVPQLRRLMANRGFGGAASTRFVGVQLRPRRRSQPSP